MAETHELGYATNRSAIKSKLEDRAHKIMFLGYAEDHEGDCFRLYKLATRKVILSRDVRWTGRTVYETKGGERQGNEAKERKKEAGTDGSVDSDVEEDDPDGTIIMERGDSTSGGTTPTENTTDDAETEHESGEDQGVAAAAPGGGRTLRERSGIPLTDLLMARSMRRNLEDVEIALVSAVNSDVGEPVNYQEAVESKQGG